MAARFGSPSLFKPPEIFVVSPIELYIGKYGRGYIDINSIKIMNSYNLKRIGDIYVPPNIEIFKMNWEDYFLTR